MAGFDEIITREYFELNGFLVRQVKKYKVQARKKRADEEIDLLVYNPSPEPSSSPPGFQLFSSDIQTIHRAIVVVKGWHTTSFTPRMMRQSSKIFDFLKKDVLEVVEHYFSADNDLMGDLNPISKILVLPGLPSTDPHREESIALLKEHGVDHIITFRTLLENLLRGVEPNHSYQKSEVLHLLRLLKIYDMIRAPQMELFSEDRARGHR